MGKVNFSDYQQEFKSIGIGDLLYTVIMSIAERIVPHYPSSLYPPYYSEWNANSIREVAHDFIVLWLLEAGRLEYYLFSLDSAETFEKILYRELKQFMANHRRRSELANLFKRTKKLLNDSPEFRSFGYLERNNEIWGFIGWDNKPTVISEDEILKAMWEVALPPLVKYRADSKKISHLVSDKSLQHLLKETFSLVSKKIDLTNLARAFRYRLGLIEITEKSFDDFVKSNEIEVTYSDYVAASNVPIEELISAEEIAKDIFELLTDRQRQILTQYLASSNGTLQPVADALNLSKSTIHNELKIIEQLISTYVEETESENVFASLSELCQANEMHKDNHALDTANYEEKK